jgi:peptidoglycan/LPS O-acetylase OafA/YrhL
MFPNFSLIYDFKTKILPFNYLLMQSSLPHKTPLLYRADIDGLRTVAVFSVVGFHAFPDWIKGGYVGVDVFFVISGFLISTILLKSLKRGDFSFLEFYSRRIKRIFPAMLLVMIVSLIFGWFILLADEYQQLGKHIAGGASFVSNFVLWNESGYFDPAAASKPLLHLWSLGIEEQFYIIWPLFLYLGWHLRFNILSIMLIIAIASFATNLVTISSNPVSAFYSPLSRFWELLMGGMLAFFTIRHSRFLPNHDNLKSLLGFLMITISLFTLNHNSAFPGYWALLPTIGAVLILSSDQETWLNRTFLAHPIMVWFGIISYPLYLWHWPLLSIAYIVEGRIPTRGIRVVAVLCSIALAWLTYRYLEKKIRFRNQGMITGLLILLSLTTMTIGILAWQETIKPRLNDKQLEKIVTAVEDWDYPPRSFEVFKYEDQNFYSKLTTREKVLFLGDSYMEHYGPRIEKLLSGKPKESKSVIFATTGGCLPIPHVFEDKHPECQPRLNAARNLALGHDIDTVVIGANWWSYFVKQVQNEGEFDREYYFQLNGAKEYFKGGNGVDLSLDALAEFLEFLASSKKVYLILNSPVSPTLSPKNFYDGSRFGQLRYKPKTDLLKSEFDKDYEPLKKKLVSIGKRAGVTIIDPLEYLCTEGICPGIMPDGTPIYKDGGHIRPFFSRNYCDFIDSTVGIEGRLSSRWNH